MIRFRLSAAISLAMLLALIVLATACLGPREYTDSNVPIEVKAGEEFAIVLDSNRTTGYEWQLEKPLDESILTLVNSEYHGSFGGVGAGGKETWTFRAVSPGETTIALRYARPGESDPRTATNEAFTVIVK